MLFSYEEGKEEELQGWSQPSSRVTASQPQESELLGLVFSDTFPFRLWESSAKRGLIQKSRERRGVRL